MSAKHKRKSVVRESLARLLYRPTAWPEVEKLREEIETLLDGERYDIALGALALAMLDIHATMRQGERVVH